MVSSVLIFMFVPLKSSNDHIQTFPIPIFSQLLKCTPKQNINFYQDQINLQPSGGFFFFFLRIQIDYKFISKNKSQSSNLIYLFLSSSSSQSSVFFFFSPTKFDLFLISPIFFPQSYYYFFLSLSLQLQLYFNNKIQLLVMSYH